MLEFKRNKQNHTKKAEENLPAFSLFDSYLKRDFSLRSDQCVKNGRVKIYSCGPTVYNYQSIGNMRAVFLPDTLKKVLNVAGYEVEWTLNITDVGHLVGDGDRGEDKIEKMARQSQNTVEFIVNHYTKDYFEQCEALNFDLPKGKHNPKASEYILEQMELVKVLLQKKLAYILQDGVYFDFLAFSKTEDFTKLPVTILNSLNSVKKENHCYNDREIENTQKDPRDFALWKFIDENSLQKWKFIDFENMRSVAEIKNVENKWGCPGWHSECVAMICKTLNGHFLPILKENKDFVIDVHMGGEDHIDIHHKNEILQSLGLGFNLSKHWVHNKFVMVDGQKMSKSLGNVYLVKGEKSKTGFESLEENGFNPLDFRLMLLEHSYDQQMNFTWEKLKQAQKRLWGLKKLTNFIKGFADFQNMEPKIENFKADPELLQILLNNLNTPLFLEKYTQIANQTVNQINKEKILKQEILDELVFWENAVLKLGLFEKTPEEIKEMLEKRKIFKTEKNWEKADEIKAKILEKKYTIDDHFYGSVAWKM